MILIHKHSLLNDGNSRQMDQEVVHFFDEVKCSNRTLCYPCLTIRIYERCIWTTEIKSNILNQMSWQVVHFML